MNDVTNDYAAVSDMQIEIRIKRGGSLDENPLIRHHTLANPPGEIIRCPKAGCVDGGWYIVDILRDMIARKETDRKTGGICKGKQRMGRAGYRDCLTDFEANIHLKYKD